MSKQLDKYQVAIVGGGLAGLTLAIQLADAGYSCILFEKNSYPFHKVCGEYISMESRDFLERLGLNLNEMQLPEIRQLRVSSPSGNVMHTKLDLGGFGISRYFLDWKLSELAKKKGIQLMEQCRVSDVQFSGNEFEIISSHGHFKAECCIGAWGKKSNLDTKLNRLFTKHKIPEKNYVGIKYHINIDFPSDVIELHNFENGYCGISKIENNTYCLCYLTDAENLKRYNGNIKMMEEKVLMSNPFLKKYFTEATFLFEEPLAISNIRIGYKAAVENHILMLGDTAGNIAPLSGNGMSMAMRSSFQLFGFLDAYFKKKVDRATLEKHYSVFWNAQFKKRVQFSEFLQRLLKNTAMTNVAISILKALPFLRRWVVKSTHGKPF